MVTIFRSVFSLFSVVAAFALPGCGDSSYEWREQVKLQSGESIVVKRTAKFSENWVAGGGGGSYNRGMTVEIAQAVSPQNPSQWSGLYVPMILDRDQTNGEWFMVATFFHCESWYDLGRPPLPYVEFRFHQGRWVQQQLSPSRIGRTTNIFIADPAAIKELVTKDPVSVEAKDRVLEDPAIGKKFKSVVGEWKTTC